MKRNKILGAALLMATMVTLTAGTFATSANFSHEETPVEEIAKFAVEQDNLASKDGIVEEELDADKLAITVNKSQVTPNSQSYSVEFSSKAITYTDRNARVFVAITDLPADPKEFEEIKKQECVDGHDLADEDEKECEIHDFTGAVYAIKNMRKGERNDIRIPQTLTYADAFRINIKSINGNVIRENPELIDSITIPATIDEIKPDAFAGVKEDCVIKCEADVKPDTYFDGFAPEGVEVQYGYDLTKTDIKQMNLKVSGAPYPFGTGQNFIIGYNKDGDYYPLTISFDVWKNGEFLETRYKELPIENPNGMYDGVGSEVGSLEVSKNIDIVLAEGEEVKDETLTFYNIFKAVKKANPDGSPNWFVDKDEVYKAKGRKNFVKKEHIEDYLSYEYASMSRFLGYTTLHIDVNFKPESYEALKRNVIESHIEAWEAGELEVRYRVYNLHKTLYHFTYLGVDDNGNEVVKEKVLNIEPALIQFVCEEKDQAVYMFKDTDIAPDFNSKNLLGLDIYGFTVNIDLFSNETFTPTNRSSLISRFAVVPIIPTTYQNLSSTITNYNSILMWIAIGTVLAYVAATLAYFFYAKNAYKNDEFKRVKPKKFFLNALYGLIGTLLTVFTITFICVRAIGLDNSIVVFNPVDPFIIAFTVIDIIVIGYGIKMLVNSIKANNIKRRNEKLKIGSDEEADDGTK